MIKLVVFVPETHAEQVKRALFDAGAGRQGDYEHCCWQSAGTGQFKPCEGSAPFIGSQGELSQVPELRIEMLVDDERLKEVVRALRESHPYEEPAFDCLPLLAIPDVNE